jgi:hypothetical protein
MLLSPACTLSPDPPRAAPSPTTSTIAAPTIAAPAIAAPTLPVSPVPRPAIDRERYPWLAGATDLAPVDALEDRIAPPAGFSRISIAKDAFGAWLRRLPLAAPGTPVLSHRGGVILPADHDNLAAVVALDIGNQDLQQCADSVIRLHAEWRWSQGHRDHLYQAADKTPMPFEHWARGERVVGHGSSIAWTPATRRPDSSHAAFRGYLDAVFGWTNTVALARDTVPVALADLRPGDFVVQPGSPGHAVLVLDLATAPDGRRAVLLGQGFMPAQNFQVLRPTPESAWFMLAPDALKTPFWPAFPWSSLHRFPGS